MNNRKNRILIMALVLICLIGGYRLVNNNSAQVKNDTKVELTKKPEDSSLVTESNNKQDQPANTQKQENPYITTRPILAVLLKDSEELRAHGLSEKEVSYILKGKTELENIIEYYTGDCNYRKQEEVPSKISYDIGSDIREAYLTDKKKAEEMFNNYLISNNNSEECNTQETTINNSGFVRSDVKFAETEEGQNFIKDTTLLVTSGTKEEIDQKLKELTNKFSESGESKDWGASELAWQKIMILNNIKNNVASESK